MSTVNITINGKPLTVPAGITVLEAAKLAGVEIPTLCHHPALEHVGACRLCVVEVDNQPALQPSCSYPVFEDMHVQTESERVMDMRRFVLELLFSERNHYCMFCEMSGDCELQTQAYNHGLVNWPYPAPHPRYPVDASRQYFLMDHNRCILCRRCIRACGDIVANHTIGVHSRGSRTMITADMDAPFGDSTCVECGTCLQVCPTGALVDRKSAYMGRRKDVTFASSTCSFCSVGCRTLVATRNERPLRVEGDWDGHNTGVLCIVGRFHSLDEKRNRLTTPMIRKSGTLSPATWDEALDYIAKAVKASPKEKAKAWVTGKALNETLDAAISAFKDKAGVEVRSLEPLPQGGPLPNGGKMADIDQADRIFIIDVDLLADHRVMGYRIRRCREREAAIILCCDSDNSMVQYATARYPLAKLDDALKECRPDEKVFVVYRADLPAAIREKLEALKDKATLMPLYNAANLARSMSLGLKHGAEVQECQVAYVLARDLALSQEQRTSIRKSAFVVLHGCYDDAADIADVVLPAPVWFEEEGALINAEGIESPVRAAAPMPEGIRAETSVLQDLAARL
ncbi:MAG: molybdopterin-dependent oxidoreductase [Armatimonadetes bacterium]|nr:molybdopterin-dependent oxidoreductase [Armatimonadota bacterium]